MLVHVSKCTLRYDGEMTAIIVCKYVDTKAADVQYDKRYKITLEYDIFLTQVKTRICEWWHAQKSLSPSHTIRAVRYRDTKVTLLLKLQNFLITF